MHETSQKLIQILQDVLGKQENLLGLHEPQFAGNEWNYVRECIDTGWVSSVGSYVDLFEEKLAKACGKKFAIVTVNGTEALHIALKLSGVKEGDEVLVPSLTFVATVNAISYCGAKPHFVDVEKNTLGIDPEKLDEYLSTYPEGQFKAIMPVHVFGHPCKIDQIEQVAEKHAIPVITDAAEALGSEYRNKPVTSYGLLTTVSFNGNKIITTGGGGAILTDDEQLAKRAKHITTTAKLPHAWAFIHDEIGYNYRMPNINAALGCAQLEQLEGFIHAKRKLAKQYEKAFKTCENLDFHTEPQYAQSNYWLNALILKEKNQRDVILKDLHKVGILCRPVWDCMHTLKIYEKAPRMNLSVTEDIAPRIINIPSSAKFGLS